MLYKNLLYITLIFVFAAKNISFAKEINNADLKLSAKDAPAQGCEDKSEQNFAQRFYQTYKEHLNYSGKNPPPLKHDEDTIAASMDSPPMPFSSANIGGIPPFGYADGTVSPLMDTIYCGKNGQKIKDSRIKLYGWIEPGFNVSNASSHHDISEGRGGNYPASFYHYPNQLMLNQAVLTLERLPDTLQKDHIDYGFRVLGIYGSDYKYTIANNLLSNSYLKDHKKYDFNPAFFYGDIYIPYIAKGLNIRTGHYISIPDIETQLAPTNYTYSHSLTYSFVPFSHDGVVSTLKFNKNWMAQFEISAGSDVSALDTKNRKFTPGGCVSYTTDSGNDNFYPCINGINNGRYAYNNVQDLVATWYHKFNEKWHTYTQGYYMWQKSVPSVSDPNAPPTINGSNGAYCRNGDATCRADAFAGLNYLVYKFHPKDFITFRNEFLKDTQGQRSGYKTLYTSHLISWSHWIGDVITIRPELRFDHSYNAKAYDNGQKSNLYVFATDMIIHF